MTVANRAECRCGHGTEYHVTYLRGCLGTVPQADLGDPGPEPLRGPGYVQPCSCLHYVPRDLKLYEASA